ncbi:unnamed protein product [Parnassius apollo]|uniref:(apollo) hypothetical protein n=1 Tax=Parnassius apollo TaxID=110799 RepID=A0A8S3X789_PARAO|nr:unnamed protein product [Parnassius apollo]
MIQVLNTINGFVLKVNLKWNKLDKHEEEKVGRPAYGALVEITILEYSTSTNTAAWSAAELSHQEFQEVHSVRPPPPPISPTAYPVQPGVRDSATAMAMLCRSLPQDTVFPTSPASPAKGVSAFSPNSPVLLASPSRLPMSPTSPSRRTFAYYTSPRRSLTPTSPTCHRRSLGSPSRLPLSPTFHNHRGPMSPSRRAATVPARRVKSPHKPPVIILSPADHGSPPLRAPTVIPMR